MGSLFRVHRVISGTLYGQVLECTMQIDGSDDNKVVAVKCVALDVAARARRQHDGDRTLDDPIQEAHVAQLVQSYGCHPNVVTPILQLHRSKQLCLVTELCDRGDLYSYAALRKPACTLEHDEALSVMKQVFAGVHFLHDQLGIAHRDLSLENVLISNQGGLDDRLVFKISDFALSVPIDTECDDMAGKDIYMAPEVVARRRYEPAKADVWSLGVMWFILLTGSRLVPLATASNPILKALQEVGVGAVFRAWELDELAATPSVALLDEMLRVEPAERISLASILVHPAINYGQPEM